MLSFTPTDEQQMLIDAIRRFSTDEVRAIAHDADESGELPADVLSTGWEMGVLPGNIPEDLGGFADEYSAVTGVLAYEELAFGDLAFALQLMTPALLAVPVLVAGTDAQKEEFLDFFLDETPPAVTAAHIEKHILFDPHKLQTTAARQNGGFVINGQKAYVPMAEGAEWILVYAANQETRCMDGFLVRGDADGVTVGEREKLMGVRALPTYPVTFENVQVDADHRLGVGEIDYAGLLAHSRVALGALAVGVMRGALEFAINYAKEREQFGAPIATKQAIAFMLAECAMEVDSTRLMVWEAAWKLDQGHADAAQTAYLAKQYADRAAVMVTDSAVQTLGGYGYIREFPVERWLRNARGFATFDGLAMV